MLVKSHFAGHNWLVLAGVILLIWQNITQYINLKFTKTYTAMFFVVIIAKDARSGFIRDKPAEIANKLSLSPLKYASAKPVPIGSQSLLFAVVGWVSP